jgi:hypothetical protein
MDAVLLSEDVIEVARVDTTLEVRQDDTVVSEFVERMLSDDGRTTVASSAPPPNCSDGVIVLLSARHPESVSGARSWANDITHGTGSAKGMDRKSSVVDWRQLIRCQHRKPFHARIHSFISIYARLRHSRRQSPASVLPSAGIPRTPIPFAKLVYVPRQPDNRDGSIYRWKPFAVQLFH